jgi:hypothetical protein
MLAYADPGLTAEIRTCLAARGIVPVQVAASDTTGISALVDDPAAELVVDTTSLTKPLIYSLVSQALRKRGRVSILHTCATSYFPSDQDLSKVVRLFAKKEYAKAFEMLDTIVKGEVPPFKTVVVDGSDWDSSQPAVMAVFSTLKHRRVTGLLEDLPVEKVAALAPVHTAGRSSPRSVVGRRLAEALVHAYGGVVEEVGSLDHVGAFHALVRLHADLALQAGFNFEIALSGAKMHAVAAGMFASVASSSAVFYSAPKFVKEHFTAGTGPTRLVTLERVELSRSTSV